MNKKLLIMSLVLLAAGTAGAAKNSVDRMVQAENRMLNSYQRLNKRLNGADFRHSVPALPLRVSPGERGGFEPSMELERGSSRQNAFVTPPARAGAGGRSWLKGSVQVAGSMALGGMCSVALSGVALKMMGFMNGPEALGALGFVTAIGIAGAAGGLGGSAAQIITGNAHTAVITGTIASGLTYALVRRSPMYLFAPGRMAPFYLAAGAASAWLGSVMVEE